MKKPTLALACVLGWLLLTGCTGQSSVGVTPSATPASTPSATPQAVPLGVLGNGSAHDIAWSPDGKWLAVTSSTGVRLYDTGTWQVLEPISNAQLGESRVRASVFSRDGDKTLLFLFGFFGVALHRYDLQSHQLTPWLENLQISPQTPPTFSPDGTVFAFHNRICETDQSCIVALEVRTTATGKLLYTLQPAAGQNVWNDRVAFSPKGTYLAVGSDDNHVRVWDAADGKLRYDLLHDSQVMSLAFSLDGQVLASASGDATVRFWDMQNGENLSVLGGFKARLQYVAFTPDSKKLLVSRLYENVVQEYALDEHHLPTSPLEISMAFGEKLDTSSPNATTSATIRLSPSSQTLAVLLNDAVQLWDAQTGQPILTLPGYNSQINALEIDSQDDLLALADHNVHLWRLSSRTLAGTLPINAYTIKQVAFQPNGHQLAVVTENDDLGIWDATSQRLLRTVQHESIGREFCPISHAVYSYDGTMLATVGCELRVSDAATGRLLQKFSLDHINLYLYELVFSPDGKAIIYVDKDGLHRLDLTTGKLVYSAPVPSEHDFWKVAISANLIALSEMLDGPFRFFDPLTGRHLYDFGPGRGERAIALHPQGRLFARANYGKLLLADAASGAELLSMDFDRPYLIRFSSNGRLLAASSYESTVQLWDVSSVVNVVGAISPVTATPNPVITPTLTVTPNPIPPISIQPVTPPTMSPGVIGPETIAQLHKRGELGLGQARVAAWAPDGRTVAVGISSGVYIFKWAAQKPVSFLPLEDGAGINLFAFSPDARLLAGQVSNMNVQVWDVVEGRRLHILKEESASCWGPSLSFSADNQVLSADCGERVFRWRMSDGQLLSQDEKENSSSNASSDGSLLARFGMTQAWLEAADSGEIVKTFDLPEMAPAVAQFSPDGKTLLVWFYKYSVARTGIYYPGPDAYSLAQLWTVLPGRDPVLRATFKPGYWSPETILRFEAFESLRFSPDGRRLVVASGDGQAQIWDTQLGKLLATLPDVRKIYFSPDGEKLLAVGGGVRVWDATTGKPALLWELPGFAYRVSHISFSEDGKQLFAASPGLFRSWSLGETDFAQMPLTLKTPDTLSMAMSVSPDGKWLAYATVDGLVLGRNDPSKPDWQTLSNFEKKSYYSPDPQALTFSPDSTMLVLTTPNRKVLLWHLGQLEAGPLELATDIFPDSLIFSPNGSTILGMNGFSSRASNAYLLDTSSGKLLRQWETIAYLTALHPDGVTVATTGYEDGVIQVHDLRTWQLLHEMKGLRYVRGMDFSPDGRLLVVLYDKQVQFWEVATGKLLHTLNGSFVQMAFSPDGRSLVFGPWNGILQVWGLPEK